MLQILETGGELWKRGLGPTWHRTLRQLLHFSDLSVTSDALGLPGIFTVPCTQCVYIHTFIIPPFPGPLYPSRQEASLPPQEVPVPRAEGVEGGTLSLAAQDWARLTWCVSGTSFLTCLCPSVPICEFLAPRAW